MGEVESTATAGVEWRAYRRGALSTDPADQYVVPVKDYVVSWKGRAATFVTPGRAAAVQRIQTLHNATGSAVKVCVNRVVVDMVSSVAKAITVIPPTVRIYKFTALPTGGTTLAKTPMDSALGTSNASVVSLGDSSADNTGAGTSSASALTVTSGGILAQQWAPRLISAAGYEMVDTNPFFVGEPDAILNALEGIAVTLENANTAALGNPATDRWLCFIDWEEFTRP